MRLRTFEAPQHELKCQSAFRWNYEGDTRGDGAVGGVEGNVLPGLGRKSAGTGGAQNPTPWFNAEGAIQLSQKAASGPRLRCMKSILVQQHMRASIASRDQVGTSSVGKATP